MAAGYIVGVLALEVGHRGVTVNFIVPTAIEGAGVFTDIAEDDPFRQFASDLAPTGSVGSTSRALWAAAPRAPRARAQRPLP